jgi:hypothetical protein
LVAQEDLYFPSIYIKLQNLGFWLCPTLLGSKKIFHIVPKPAYPHTPVTLLLSEPCFEEEIGKIIEDEFTWIPCFCQHDFKQINSSSRFQDASILMISVEELHLLKEKDK